jgi:phage gp36-like protein
MPYLLVEDLDTHIYSEIIEEITRMDVDIVGKAIKAAISDAKDYLRKYDLLKVFGTDTIEPVVPSDSLKDRIKDLVVWKLIKLANPNISYDTARSCYEDTIRWFERVQAGKLDLDLPMPVDNSNTKYREDSTIQWSSNPKRQNQY